VNVLSVLVKTEVFDYHDRVSVAVVGVETAVAQMIALALRYEIDFDSRPYLNHPEWIHEAAAGAQADLP
jgi:hypothetical protein